MSVVPKRRWRGLLILRRLLTCAIAAIALMALLSAHVEYDTKFPADASYKLPTQHESSYGILSREGNLMEEIGPPHLLVAPLTAHKFGGASMRMYSENLWKPPPNRDYLPCIKPSSSYTSPPESHGYLLVNANGGLNQMRAGICDMVAIARLINATLVIPELDKHSFWQDLSNFSDVFDEYHFINSLANDVKITKSFPKNWQLQLEL